MKKHIALVILILALLCPAPAAAANNYNLFGGGNCTYFAVEFIEAFWPVAFPVPGGWDAWRWKGLVGQERDGYQIVIVEEPQPGDIFIIPARPGNPRGHVGIITGLRVSYDFENRTAKLCYSAMDSTMYPCQDAFPKTIKNCLYRTCLYSPEALEDAIFISCRETDAAE